MRYKRVNTLALDVSAVPAGHRLPVVQPLLTFLKLDPTKLRSVQFHSSRKTIFIGFPDDRSAEATAKKTPRFSITIDGTKYYVPLEFVDDDVIEVRVRDLPPETPADVIQRALQQYGEVRSVTSEVWRDFFPGVLTGVKIARMKVMQTIPSRLSIGNSTALINYDGQLCSRCQKAHPNANCTAEKIPLAPGPQKQQPQGGNVSASEQQQEQQKVPPARPSAAVAPPGADKRKQMKNELDEAASDNFTVVKHKRGKTTQQQEQQQKHQKQQERTVEPGHKAHNTPIPPLSEKDQRTVEIWKECFLKLGIPMIDDSENKNNSN